MRLPHSTRNHPWIVVAVIAGMAAGACSSDPAGRGDDPLSDPGLVLHHVSGLVEDGTPTAHWLESIVRWHTAEEHAELHAYRKPLTAEGTAWAALIQSRLATWSGWADSLTVPFGEIERPADVVVLVGHVGGSDAFTPSDTTIAFNVERLFEVYGSASDAENANRIDRFFAHEMTHILHKAWRREHPVEIRSPLEYALWDCLVEGVGNYRSLSDRWISPSGEWTERAESVLAELHPVLVDRLLALEHADSTEAQTLLAGLSDGPFTRKWGALPAALWLAREAHGDDARLRPWVEAGPWGVLDLAAEYLPDSLAVRLNGIVRPL